MGKPKKSRIRKFLTELLRRKVVRVLGAYVAVLWLLSDGFSSLFPVVGIPEWVLRGFIVVGVALIPVVAFFSWRYDLVPPHLVKDVKDVEAQNPALGWALVRHDAKDAGHVLLSWNANSGEAAEKRFFRPVSIGREPHNDIVLPDQRVSRYHALLWAEAGAWHVRDLNSANGTFIGATRVNGTAKLPAVCDLRFHADGPAVGVQIARTPETLVSIGPVREKPAPTQSRT